MNDYRLMGFISVYPIFFGADYVLFLPNSLVESLFMLLSFFHFSITQFLYRNLSFSKQFSKFF